MLFGKGKAPVTPPQDKVEFERKQRRYREAMVRILGLEVEVLRGDRAARNR